MNRRPKLTWKTLSWPVVWIAIGLLLFWASVISGCVTVIKKTTIVITNPIVIADMQNGDNDKGSK